MIKRLTIGVAVTVLFSIGAAVFVVHSAGPSTAGSDKDIATVQTEIASAEADAAKYCGR
jgi:hypothetical protein